MDFLEILAKTDVELKRLGWTKEQGRHYLLQTYGKRSRHLLSDEELLNFLNYLENFSQTVINKNNTVQPLFDSLKNINDIEPSNFSETLAKTDIELKRLNWTKEEGRHYLLQTYGKRSRFMLTDEEILNFLDYLKNLPIPMVAESITVLTQLDTLDNISETDAIPF